MGGNIVEWTLKLKTSQFVAPGLAAVDTIKGIESAAAGAVPRVARMGSEIDKVSKIVKDAQGRLRTTDGRFLAGSKPSDLGLAEDTIAMLGKLRKAASDASGGPSMFEAFAQKALPTELLQAPRKLGAFSRAVQFAGRNFGGGAARGLLQLGAGLEKVQDIAAVAGPPLLALGGAAIAVGAGAAYGAAKFAQSVIQAQAFREDATRALTTLLKTREAADAALRVASGTADFIGRDRAQVAGQFVDLLAKGFDVKRVDEIVRSLSDLSTVDPKADLERLTRTIGQIAGTGRLQGDELNELANAGLETGAVYDALGKQLGKTRQEVIKLKEAGKISSDQAISAILSAINVQAGGGAAGAAAAAKSVEDLTGIFGRLAAIPKNVLFDLEVGGSIDIVKDSLREVIRLFDSTTETGQKVRRVVGEVFQALVAGLFGEGVAKGKTFEQTFNTILDSISASTPQIQEFASSIRSIGEFSALIVGLVGSFNELRSSISDMGAAGSILKVLFLPIVLATDGVFYLIDAFLWLSEAVGPALSGVGDAAANFGSDIIIGLVNGIASNAQLVVDAISGVARGAVQAAERILMIRSPSKVFEEIGAFTVAGFEQGIAANDTGAQDAIAAAVEPPSLGDIAAGGERAGAAIAGGGASAPINVTVNVDARGATGADAQRIGEQAADAVLRTLETIGLQTGAAA